MGECIGRISNTRGTAKGTGSLVERATQKVLRTHSGPGLLSLWELFLEPSQDENHLLEMYVLDQEMEFCKMGGKMKEMEKDAGNSSENIKMKERVEEM